MPRIGCPNCKPCVKFRTLRCCRRRGYSSAGRALAWHARGQRFDPAYLHQIFKDFFKSQRQLDGPAALFVLRSASSRSSRGLGHDPFTVGTGVRIPYGTPFSDKRPPQPVFFFALKKIKPLKIKDFFQKLISGRLRPSRPSKSLLVPRMVPRRTKTPAIGLELGRSNPTSCHPQSNLSGVPNAKSTSANLG